jgi:hypothetical protein
MKRAYNVHRFAVCWKTTNKKQAAEEARRDFGQVGWGQAQGRVLVACQQLPQPFRDCKDRHMLFLAGSLVLVFGASNPPNVVLLHTAGKISAPDLRLCRYSMVVIPGATPTERTVGSEQLILL